MLLRSLLRIPAEAGLKFQDRENSPLPPEGTLIPAKPKNRLKSFAQSAIGVSNSPAIYEIIGTISCMIVIAYVSGHALGTLFHEKKTQFIHTINDKINRPL